MPRIAFLYGVRGTKRLACIDKALLRAYSTSVYIATSATKRVVMLLQINERRKYKSIWFEEWPLLRLADPWLWPFRKKDWIGQPPTMA